MNVVMKIFNNDFGIWNPCVIYEAWTLHLPCFKSKFGPPSCQVIVEIYWKGIFVLSKSFNDFFTSLSITTDFVRLLRNFMMTVSGWTSSLSVWAAGGVGSLFGGPLLFGSRWVTPISCSWIGGWISRSSLKNVRSLFSSVPGPVSLRPLTLMDPLRVHCSISFILSCRAMMVDCWLAIMSSRFLSSSLSTWIVLVPMVSPISLQLGLKMSRNFFMTRKCALNVASSMIMPDVSVDLRAERVMTGMNGCTQQKIPGLPVMIQWAHRQQSLIRAVMDHWAHTDRALSQWIIFGKNYTVHSQLKSSISS